MFISRFRRQGRSGTRRARRHASIQVIKGKQSVRVRNRRGYKLWIGDRATRAQLDEWKGVVADGVRRERKRKVGLTSRGAALSIGTTRRAAKASS
jgi:hypothetical protein